MNNGIVFLAFVFILALISTFLFKVMSRKILKEQLDVVQIAFGFFSGYSFLVSAVKWYFGNREDTLVESLWDSNSMTYVHYGIPLVIAGIVISIILLTGVKKITVDLVKTFSAYFFLGIILLMFVNGSISNTVYCIAFLVCLLLSLMTVLICKRSFSCVEKLEYKNTIIRTLPFIGAAFFMNGIFLPNELYLNNVSEFSCPYGEFLIVLVIGTFLIMLFYVILSMKLLPNFLYKGMLLAVAATSIMGYIQNMFLNGKLETMDGNGQTWSIQIQISNIVIWLVIVGILVIGGYFKAGLEKFIKVVCIYIVLIQTVTLGYLMITMEHNNAKNMELTTQGALELGAEHNVIVFVLDRFDSVWMEELLEEEGDFFEPLSDFVYYRNATSQFAHTGTALPYMLTGVKWNEEEMGNIPYSEYAFDNGDFLGILKENNYNLGIYTGIGYLSGRIFGMIENYKESVDVSCDVSKTMELMLKSSLYKTTPFVVKPAYEYYSGDMTQMAKSDEIWNIDNDIPFYNSLIEQGMSVTDEYQNTFRFYHMRGAHYPYYLSEDLQYNKSGRDVSVYSQIKGCLNIIYEYIRQMKALGKYDDATIIITADHGQQVEYIAEQNMPDCVSMPLMLVKEAKRKGEALQVSSAPVSQEELIPTILKEIGVDWTGYGRAFEEIGKEEREREYLDIYKDYFIKYVINGDAKYLDSWKGEVIK